jgi:hypothetical protein
MFWAEKADISKKIRWKSDWGIGRTSQKLLPQEEVEEKSSG